MNVRRIENKLGIHGSPTCELVYKNVKAELCGRRKFGLIKYVMALMNGARLGIAAQSVGISQMAYNEALAYAVSQKRLVSTSRVGESEAIAERSHNTASSSARPSSTSRPSMK